jgi:hypothetical protein
LTAQVIVLLLAALPIYLWFRRQATPQEWLSDLKASVWLIVFLPMIALFSLFGSHEFGGLGYLPYGWDMVAVGIASALICEWGTRSAHLNPDLERLTAAEIPDMAPVH